MSAQAGYKRRNMAIWDEVAPRYHRRWAGPARGPFRSTRVLLDAVGVKGGDRVLDVACGTGAVTAGLARRVGRTGLVVGVDTSMTALGIARGRVVRNVLLVNADAENIPFDSKFDAITCQYGLFFFPDAPRALRDMRRCLAGRGRLGITVHGHGSNVPFFRAILDAVTEIMPDYVEPGTPVLDRYGTEEALRAEVAGAGFSGISVSEHVFRYSPGSFDEYWGDYLRYVPRQVGEKIGRLGRRQRAEIKGMARENAGPFTGRDGIIRFPWQVLILTAGR